MLRCPTCGKNYPSGVQFCPEDQSALVDKTAAPTEVTDPLIGHVLNEKYRIQERLGFGGMGTVYRARHLLIDREVAVKVLNKRFVEDEAARIRFQREAKAAGRLQHLNAVAVTDFGHTDEGYVYIVMELLEGRNLREILGKEAPLETARAVSLMLQISAAVAAAHEAGVIHRDLKPANIMVTRHADSPSVVKVLDFGIAKLAAETLDEDDQLALTQVGAMIGTPRYMSPEQCQGDELTPASDVYSLGVILYEMLTGLVPFSGSTPVAIAVKHASEFPRPPREIVGSIPDELQDLVLHALEKSPEQRPANAAEFRNKLIQLTEKLGLEHHAVLSSPDLAVLRDVGVESPSGRLVVDLSRLREERVLTSGSSELLTIAQDASRERMTVKANQPTSGSPQGPVISRLEIGLNSRSRSNKFLLITGMFLGALVVIGVALVATRLGRTSSPVSTNANVSASPTQVATPSPVLSPSLPASPSPSVSPKAKSSPEKKGQSFVDKVKRILKKPF